ncbi:sugar phosphate isomerase/epimerase [Alkalihalobacillus sp. TS-13]|uniref:sugar phosphate isomerase/epimerase family protein n=1 Tax=Alkalihalobacillus sp. TS-13 TaxID=2842455 RepID=UPI0021AA718F|nr:sugar phosphate isomerase/epimerase family protein [Alkalihalobacillus sp. TS-13]
MNKGINAWCFPESCSIEDIFKSARDYGYEGVELNLSDDPSAPLPLNMTEGQLLEIKEEAVDAGLSLPSLSTDLLWKYPLTDKDENVREKGIAVVEEMFRIAEVFGAETVLVVPGIVNEQVFYEKAYRRSQDSLQKLLPVAEKAGITIGIENVWNKFLLSPLEMRQFVDGFDSPNMGVYFDVGNVCPFGFPEQWIRILSHRIKSVHVKDFKARVGNINGFVPLLAGDINWKLVTEALDEIDYKGFIIPEIPPHKHFHHPFMGNLTDTMDEIFPFKRQQEDQHE